MAVLRNDLELYPWEPEADGQDIWVIHDPLRNTFFTVGRDVIDVLKHIHYGDPSAIAAQITRATPRPISDDSVKKIISFFHQNNLVYAQDTASQDKLIKEAQGKKTSLFQWVTHKYLFMRFPLLRPDTFLNTLLPIARPLMSRWFMRLTLLVGLLGIVLTLRDWDALETNVKGLISFNSAVLLAVTLVFVKLIHEFAHALVSKRYGVHVPVMGIALLVLFPLPYTDTSESWKLYHHKQRLMIAAAGVISELCLAAWATFLWKIVPDGSIQNAFFLIATTTWVSSLIINLSPFMRFDGYFVLMDYLKFPNLHSRSGALAQWKLREVLFGLGAPPPEDIAPKLRRRLIAFAMFVWAYRAMVFIGIALLVYHMFFKALGIVLFAIEIYFFLLRPVLREMGVWWRIRKDMTMNKNTVMTVAVMLGILALVMTPFHNRVIIPAVHVPLQQITVYAPEAAQVDTLFVARGDLVTQDQAVARLASEELDNKLRAAKMRAENVAEQIQLASLAQDRQGGLSGRAETWRAAEQEWATLRDQNDALNLTAPQTGRVVWITPETNSTIIAKGDPILTLATDDHARVIAYVTQTEIAALVDAPNMTFFTHAQPDKSHMVQLNTVSARPIEILDEIALSDRFGGPLATVHYASGLRFVDPHYRVTFTVDTALGGDLDQPGSVVLQGAKESVAQKLWRQVANVVIREFDF